MNRFPGLIVAGLYHPAYWETNALVGVTFTVVGLLKVYGLCHGVIGGRDKPWFQYAVGTCPTWVGRSWRGRALRYGLPFLLLGLGLWNLGLMAWGIYRHTAGR